MMYRIIAVLMILFGLFLLTIPAFSNCPWFIEPIFACCTILSILLAGTYWVEGGNNYE